MPLQLDPTLGFKRGAHGLTGLHVEEDQIVKSIASRIALEQFLLVKPTERLDFPEQLRLSSYFLGCTGGKIRLRKPGSRSQGRTGSRAEGSRGLQRSLGLFRRRGRSISTEQVPRGLTRRMLGGARGELL
jgi:hypothetical protein